MPKFYNLLTMASFFCFAFLATQPLFAEDTTTPQAASDVRPERREFREEMKQLRADHEALQAEQEKLLSACSGAKDQAKIECNKQSAELRAKQKALHERRVALHEKIHQEHAHPQNDNPAATKQPSDKSPVAKDATP